MNLYGSYRALLGNSNSAMLAAIEIYNKPKFNYRSECFVILLLNAWELAFKAVLSKNKIRIYQDKKRGAPYRTLELFEAIKESQPFFPAEIPFPAVFENIGCLAEYRNRAIHFYNEKGFESVIYGLAQTSIVNYRDMIYKLFDVDIATEVNISLLPLSFASPPDPIAFLGEKKRHAPAVDEFLTFISERTKLLEDHNIDTGRFLTVFKVSLQSTKKVQAADLVVGVDNNAPDGLIVLKNMDPNISHPYTARALVRLVGEEVKGVKFSTYVFQALAWRHKLKEIPQFCWKNKNSNTYQYSPQLISHIKALSADEIRDAVTVYKGRN